MRKIDEQKKKITEAAAARIRQLRLEKGCSQEEVSLTAGINPAYYGQVERGLKCPTIDTLYKISLALDEQPQQLRVSSSIVVYRLAFSMNASTLASHDLSCASRSSFFGISSSSSRCSSV